MTDQLSNITDQELNNHLSDLILSDLVQVIDARQKGHCLQITDLPANLMELICERLREARPQCEAYVLNPEPNAEWHITSTKLIERRNAEEAIIVVFLPPDLRTSAEDSFDVSTFERFPISNLYNRLKQTLLNNLSDDIQKLAIDVIRESECNQEVAICRYLLAVQKSDNQQEAIGVELHYLGLVPHANLLDNLDVLRPKLNRNLRAVRVLSSPDDALFAKIQRLELNEGRTPIALFHFFNKIGSFDKQQWLSAILDKKFIDELTFDKWDFREKVTGDIEDIVITDLGATGVNDDGYPMFNIYQDKHLKTAWETTPPPIQCNDLAFFTVEIMQDGVPVTEARTVRVGRSKSKTNRTTIKNLDKLDLEEGLYYLRVSAWASGSSLLHNVDSESIFFKGGAEDVDDIDEDVPPRQQRQISVSSTYEAMLQTQVKLRSKNQNLDELVAGLKKTHKRIEMNWFTPERRAGGRYTDQFTIKFNSANQYTLPINTILRRIEEETLVDADSLGRWELDLTRPITAEIQPTLQPFEGIEYNYLDDFLLIRKDLFQRILNQPGYPDVPFLIETSDLSQWETEIIQYAEAYINVLEKVAAQVEKAKDTQERQLLLFNNRQITAIDCVRLFLPDDQEAYFVTPTHPLKMLWALQFARITHQWIGETDDLPTEQVSWTTFARFLPKISSLNIPNALVNPNGDLFINADSFGPFWTIYVPLEIDDVRALVGRIKSLLGSPEADERFTTITGLDLARMVQRYLVQHPYVSTLRINAVQPGSGAILVEMLLELEKLYPDLRYHLHLFSADFHPEELGRSLDELMSPSEKRGGREELDAFLTASQNALFPKLTYSKHDLSNLHAKPEDFEVHITFLFDAFKVEIETSQPVPGARSNHLFGLLHEYTEQFSSEGGNISWKRQIVPSYGVDLEGDKPVHDVLVNLFQSYNEMIASVASKGSCQKCVPTIVLPLGHADKNLVNQVHQISDWVFTIDRNFGLDYLDNPYDGHCPAYLIDYQPEYLGEAGHRLVISTQQVAEIERIVRPVLGRLNLSNDKDEARAVVNALRSISGRLVLKLISSPQMANGALGMALARLFLERANLLNDMILIPLDAHVDLFTTARKEAERLGQELSLQRTDLLLTEIDPDANMLTFHLVEVKFRQDGNVATAIDLKQQIADQLENSIDVLRRLYDPHYTVPDRFDRPIRTRELSTLLSFYLERAIRYKLIAADNLNSMNTLLNQIEGGYGLRFTRHGVVFCLGDNGYTTEEDGGVTYHYLGIDEAEELIKSAVIADSTHKTLEPDPDYATTRTLFTKRASKNDRDINALHLQAKAVEEIVDKTSLEQPAEGIKFTRNDPRPNISLDVKSDAQIAQIQCDILLGSKHITPQFGVLGQLMGQSVGVDLNGTNTISLFGVQGSGKSYTLGTILEMALMPIPSINKLPRPLASVVFHYSKTEDYKPEFVSLIHPNEGKEIDILQKQYHAIPDNISDMLVLVPMGKLEKRRQEMPGIKIEPIVFDSSELDIEDWKFLMGVMGNDAMYIKKMNQVLRKIRNELNLNNLYRAVADSKLTDAQIELARTRLDFVKEYIQDGNFLRECIHPGRLIVVDLRDELIEQDEALGLFMVMLKIFANANQDGNPFSKLVVFDEAHKYMNSSFINEVTSVVREMRHKATSVLIASQDPKSVPLPIIELSSQIILHRFSSPAWLKHIQKGSVALQDLTAGKLNMLKKGQAYIWSREATHPEFETRAVKIDIRPRVTKHGGETIQAVQTK